MSEIAAKKVACESPSKWDLSIQQEKTLFQLYKCSRKHEVRLAKMTTKEGDIRGETLLCFGQEIQVSKSLKY